MSLILHLDTTTPCLMLGLSQHDAILSQRTFESTSQRYHSAIIIPEIQALLQHEGKTVQDLTALAICNGPGSFTGLRTGLVSARTMAQFLDIPVHVFNRFELLACHYQATDSPRQFYLDALRDRAYTASLALGPAGPEYQENAHLASLDPTIKVTSTRNTYIEASLSERFSSDIKLIAPSLPSPELMLKLINRYPTLFSKPWPAVKPLYLQDPNITVRKSQSGKL